MAALSWNEQHTVWRASEPWLHYWVNDWFPTLVLHHLRLGFRSDGNRKHVRQVAPICSKTSYLISAFTSSCIVRLFRFCSVFFFLVIVFIFFYVLIFFKTFITAMEQVDHFNNRCIIKYKLHSSWCQAMASSLFTVNRLHVHSDTCSQFPKEMWGLQSILVIWRNTTEMSW